ncbi:hypothetical protein CLV47_108128 [Antricoccus suffuscus]|uniref:Uncharacterized protein n=1 Tax=Antricoccus suffuscus TaxID=1629062 RepID=A0A2T0ZZI6_9ACTN|nr:hypothetical protein [Antricoccus suffuscus]PRZ41769.1 hypothetical protein CLV47_108128 [Antricoccus suffuscus]
MGGSSIFAETDKFMSFSTATGKSMTTFMDAAGTPIGQLGAKMGMCGVPGGQNAMTYYRSVIEQFNQLMEDLPMGVGALSQGAVTIGANYIGADLDSEAGMNVVADTFNPKKGDQTTQDALQKQAEKDGKNPDNQTKDGKLPAADDMTPDSYEKDNQTEGGQAYNDASAHQTSDANNGNGERKVWGKDPEEK